MRLTNEAYPFCLSLPQNSYEVLPKSGNCLAKITELIKTKYDGQCGIVYCFSQMDCERCATYLTVTCRGPHRESRAPRAVDPDRPAWKMPSS